MSTRRPASLIQENEQADKQARNEALRNWAKTRSLIVRQLMKRATPNRPARITRLLDNPVFVVSYDQPSGDKPTRIITQLEWNSGSYYGWIEERKPNEFTLSLYLNREVDYGSVKCSETALAAFLDEQCKSTFIHEYIHFLDALRYDSRPGVNDQARKLNAMRADGSTSFKDYYAAYLSTSFESNAHYHQMVSRYLLALRTRQVERPKSAQELFAQFGALPWDRSARKPISTVMAQMPDDQRKKWLRRLANLYLTRFARSGPSTA